MMCPQTVNLSPSSITYSNRTLAFTQLQQALFLIPPSQQWPASSPLQFGPTVCHSPSTTGRSNEGFEHSRRAQPLQSPHSSRRAWHSLRKGNTTASSTCPALPRHSLTTCARSSSRNPRSRHFWPSTPTAVCRPSRTRTMTTSSCGSRAPFSSTSSKPTTRRAS